MPLVASALGKGGGLGVQLLRRFRGLILEGALAPGERLPSSRSLAKALGCARGTVEACYGDLEAEGLIERRRGDGSYISKTLERYGFRRNHFRDSRIG
jgi:GntR family transcriptional regulator/MocR family aminotransferase